MLSGFAPLLLKFTAQFPDRYSQEFGGILEIDALSVGCFRVPFPTEVAHDTSTFITVNPKGLVELCNVRQVR